jgi:Uma2 family endonuclease
MATNPSPAKVTFAEYLEQERHANYKSEYRAGEVFAMAGGTPAHAELSMRMGFLLKSLLGCRVFSSDLKVFAKAVNEAMYPDVSVACDELQFQDERKDVILNPTLVVEVLSPSTREYDLSLKASFYRTIPSVKALFLVDSERQYVQRQTRTADSWHLAEFTQSHQLVYDTTDCAFTLADIYTGILP